MPKILKLKHEIERTIRAKLHESQGGKCLICQTPYDLVMDHCHKTGQIRSLLCGRCNTGFGFFRESPKILDRAAQYAAYWVAIESTDTDLTLAEWMKSERNRTKA